MKLYMVRVCGAGGAADLYAGTKRDAKKLQQDMESKYGRVDVDAFCEVDVPTDKAGLIAFLNGSAP